ncbi:hypothetical protein ACTGJ9_029585 [Bradyrhizobium sp. RDM12]
MVRADEGFPKAKSDAKWHLARLTDRIAESEKTWKGSTKVLAAWSLRGGLLFVSSAVVLLQSIRVLRLANA